MSNETKKVDGLKRMLEFLAFLNKQGIIFTLHNRAPDSLSVDFATIGSRYEVDFFVKEMRFSHFPVDEDVQTGEQKLKDLILQNLQN